MAEKPAVLVTRPTGQADGLCRGLENSGYRAHSQPLLELVAVDSPDRQQQDYIDEIDAYSHIIFISSNAVRFGMAWIQSNWPQLPENINCHAIGSVTADSLHQCGVSQVNSVRDMSSEGLLASPLLHEISGQRVLIVKGYGGRVSLRDELSGRGALVDELNCYRRQCPSMTAGGMAKILAECSIGIILISSGEGLDNLLALYGPGSQLGLLQIPLVVPSARVARQAQDNGFLTVQTAANASDVAMLEALEAWWLTNSCQSVESNE